MTMSDYNLRIGMLAGYNKGKALRQELREKRRVEKLGCTNNLARGYKILRDVPGTGRTVLEHSLDSVIDKEVFIVGDKEEIHEALPDLETTIYAQSGSLLENIGICLEKGLENSFKGYLGIQCADLTCMKKEDWDDFEKKAVSLNKDVVVGVGIMQNVRDYIDSHPELKKAGELKKGEIRFYDNIGFCDIDFPSIHYGNTFLISSNMADRKEKLMEYIAPFLSMKKLVRNPSNIPKMFTLLNPSQIFRLAASNILNTKNPNYYMRLSELVKIIEHKILRDKFSLGFVELHPRAILDYDDDTDLLRNKLIKEHDF